jgi:hypothetical protein
MIAFFYGIRSEMIFAFEYGSSPKAIANSGITPVKESEELASNRNNMDVLTNQQNECQGNIVICQNILTKYICAERAVCIIGNLDPFLLVLPN